VSAGQRSRSGPVEIRTLTRLSSETLWVKTPFSSLNEFSRNAMKPQVLQQSGALSEEEEELLFL